MSTNPSPRGYFVNRENGALCQVTQVDTGYAAITVVSAGTVYQMPISEYNSRFGDIWRPALIEEVIALFIPSGFVPPENVPADWAADWGFEVEA